MGSYTFTWEHSAHEVFVTGSFDDWRKTVKLEKEDGIFKKTVELPKTKHQYKFVVDGSWVTNDSAPKEADDSGNFNNVLTPDDIKEQPVSTLSSAAPESSTAALAGAVPKESLKTPSSEELPGAFPLTPPVETPGNEPRAFSINPIPATEGLGNPVKLEPGEKVPHPSTLTSNTVESTVKHDKEPEEASVSVAPIPATAGAGNPIHLAPGEKVPDPSTLTSNTVSSTAKTDAASYEKSDAQPPQLGPVVFTPETEREAKGGMFSLPPLAGSVIPESSLPKDVDAKTEQDPAVTIQSAAPTSTTAALAGEVPKEPTGVPEAVSESQKEAGFEPEASANPEAVVEKGAVEQELKEKVPEEPATSESSATKQVGEVAAVGAAGVAGAAATFAAATYAAKDKAAETLGLNGQATANDVPEIVAQSQKEAHVSPEAAANPEAVEEKKQVESELLQGVGKDSQATAADAVPAVVAESQKEAHASPEAAANPEAVVEKKEVESELLKEVKKVTESGDPAPTVTAATSATAPGLSDEALTDSKPLKSSSEPDALNAPASAPAQPETTQPVVDSRDVSPMSKQPTTTQQTEPTVTTGVQTGTTEAKTTPETPKKDTAAPSNTGTPESVASGTADKKKKRRSIFGKLKEKFSSK
ncbi:Cruciform DNA binding protein [Kalmusia sp. IMI 367209]|nr:Cruciform DNA binding protein [Kalmusia sp. IMI 367209]